MDYFSIFRVFRDGQGKILLEGHVKVMEIEIHYIIIILYTKSYFILTYMFVTYAIYVETKGGYGDF